MIGSHSRNSVWSQVDHCINQHCHVRLRVCVKWVKKCRVRWEKEDQIVRKWEVWLWILSLPITLFPLDLTWQGGNTVGRGMGRRLQLGHPVWTLVTVSHDTAFCCCWCFKPPASLAPPPSVSLNGTFHFLNCGVYLQSWKLCFACPYLISPETTTTGG